MWPLRKLYFYYLYLRKPRWDTGITPPEVVAYAGRQPAGRALDLGCGTGTSAIYLARCGWQVTGVDYVQTAVWAARKKASQAGVKVDFHCDDVTELRGIRAPFDLVLDIGCLHSLEATKRETYISNLERLLINGGTFLLYTFVLQDQQTGVGLTGRDIRLLSEKLRLVERTEGSDHGTRSVWFTWRKMSG